LVGFHTLLHGFKAQASVEYAKNLNPAAGKLHSWQCMTGTPRWNCPRVSKDYFWSPYKLKNEKREERKS